MATPGGAGAHAVFDGVGKDTFERSLACLRKRGMCVLFGAASGQVLMLAAAV
jgi:NADPH2:quinone reductase